MFRINNEITLDYPVFTHVRFVRNSPSSERNMIIRDVRDLVRDPLTAREYLRRPYVSRSRWLLTAFDTDRKVVRQVYPGSSIQFSSPGTLQLAIYQPGCDRPEKLIGRQFEPTVSDRKALAKLLQKWLKEHQDEPEYADQLRVIASDTRIVA